MAIRGSLREASLPDVLQLLAMGKKTGCLSLNYRQQFGTVHFEKGRICWASIVNRRDRLGDLLVRDGLITRAQLDNAIDEQARRPDRRLGDLLVGAGCIERGQLQHYIELQIREAVYHLFTWSDGTFTFDPDQRLEGEDIAVSIGPESMLLEGARRVDEWSVIATKVTSFDLIFAIDRERLAASAVTLTAEQASVVPFCDGVRDVAAIVEASGLEEFDVGKALYGLCAAGFAHRVGRSRGPDTIATESRVLEHRNLGVAFYRTGMLDEALREFRRVLELRPGDAVAEFHLGLVALRQGRLDDAIHTFRQRATHTDAPIAVHLNLGYALERAGRFDEARAALLDAERRHPPDPTLQLALAVLVLRKGDVSGAESHLQQCAALWASRLRPAAWFHYAGLVAALRGELDRAIAVLEEAVRTWPHEAVLQNNLAACLERRGRYLEAASAAERGSLDDPTLPQLHKNLGDLLYRAARYDDALEAYQRAIRYQPELGGDVYLKVGNIRFRRQEQDEAIRCWERSLDLAPDNPMARNNLEAARRIG